MDPLVHFEIHAQDPPRALAFYREVFGWRDNTVPGMEQQYWLLTAREEGQPGINGGLLVRRGPPPQDGAAVNAFVCILQVQDLEATHAKVLRHGGTVALPPFDVPGVGRVFYGKDTEGNLFGVLQPAR